MSTYHKTSGHVLICGAAGFTNRGDDAILWGMLQELRPLVGARQLLVAGGPNWANCLKVRAPPRFPTKTNARLARAIEDADLVVLGGGGLLYEVGLRRRCALLRPAGCTRPGSIASPTSPPPPARRGHTTCCTAMGAGPLLTEAARRAARALSASRPRPSPCGTALPPICWLAAASRAAAFTSPPIPPSAWSRPAEERRRRFCRPGRGGLSPSLGRPQLPSLVLGRVRRARTPPRWSG